MMAATLPGRQAWAADSVPATVIIVDSSGSMSAQEPDGRAKLDAARDTIAEALGAWPEQAELAVVAYGHRRTGDCSDIETIVPLGPVSIGVVEERLAALRARGKTPLSNSLRIAADLLPASGGGIVLVSDGLENCDADPCAVARALTEGKADVTIHVIGFGVTKAEQAQLQCIASNGGGRFFEAADAGGLASALGKVAMTIAAPEPIAEAEPIPLTSEPAPETEPEPTAVPQQVGLVATAGALGRIVDSPVEWTVTAGEGEVVYHGESRALAVSLTPGAYEVVARAANVVGSAMIRVAADESPQTFEVAVDAGRLDLTLSASLQSEPFDDLEAQGVVWGLAPLDGQSPVEVLPLARPSLLLAPGRYAVEARLEGMQGDGVVEVVAGEATPFRLDFQLGTIVLEAALAEDGPALTDDAALSWRVGEDPAAIVVDRESRPSLTLPAGRYPVTLTVAGFEITADVEAEAGEERIARLIVQSGELALSARLGPEADAISDWRDATWTVEAVAVLGLAPGAQGTETALIEAAPLLTLPPGKWRVAIESGITRVAQEVDVAPGSLTPLVIDIEAARLTMVAAPAGGAAPVNIVYSVFALDPDGRPETEPVYAAGSSSSASIILPAGRWQVTAIDEAQRAATEIVDLGAGEERELPMVLK